MMEINDVTINNYGLLRRQTGRKTVRTLYKGDMYCPEMPLHGKQLMQISVTKVDYVDECGERQWGEPVTTFQLTDNDLPFDSIKELISYHNGKQSLRALKYKGIEWQVSSCGTVIFANGKRKKICARRLPSQRLLHEVHAGNRVWNARRLVAFAWLGKPKNSKMRVLLKNMEDEHNIHYTNLEWHMGSHSTERAIELAKHMNK